MDEFDELVIVIAVFELFADVPKVVNVELSLTSNVQKREVLSSSFFREGAALN